MHSLSCEIARRTAFWECLFFPSTTLLQGTSSFQGLCCIAWRDIQRLFFPAKAFSSAVTPKGTLDVQKLWGNFFWMQLNHLANLSALKFVEQFQMIMWAQLCFRMRWSSWKHIYTCKEQHLPLCLVFSAVLSDVYKFYLSFADNILVYKCCHLEDTV